ncbi:MAG TPA: hypothetical protein VKH43_11820 [Thermoanaerobaculia bacterium]|nr:hypothetical protein [Thermoanaerobaculia bacterium]
MTTTHSLTRDIGQAERAMRALLERLLRKARLSFPEWTVLVFLDGSGPLAREDLVRRMIGGRVVPDAATARATLDFLLSEGLLGTDGSAGDDVRLELTGPGEAVYGPLRQAVSRITDELYGNLSFADVEATHRTLTEVVRRANERLATPGLGVEREER